MRKLILLKVLFNASTRLWSVYLTTEVYLLLAHDDPWFLSPSNSININFPLTDYCIWFPWQQLPTWHSFIYMETVIEAKLLHNQRWIDELHFFRAESYRLGGAHFMSAPPMERVPQKFDCKIYVVPSPPQLLWTFWGTALFLHLGIELNCWRTLYCHSHDGY